MNAAVATRPRRGGPRRRRGGARPHRRPAPRAAAEDLESRPRRRRAGRARSCWCPRATGRAPTRCCCAPPARSAPPSAPTRAPATSPRRARRAALVALARELPGLALDIDTPRDLAALMARAAPGPPARPARARAAGPRRRERPLRLWPLSALPEVRPGDDLAGMLAERGAAEGVAPGRRADGGPEGGEQGRGADRGAGRGPRRGPRPAPSPGRPARTPPCAS